MSLQKTSKQLAHSAWLISCGSRSGNKLSPGSIQWSTSGEQDCRLDKIVDGGDNIISSDPRRLFLLDLAHVAFNNRSAVSSIGVFFLLLLGFAWQLRPWSRHGAQGMLPSHYTDVEWLCLVRYYLVWGLTLDFRRAQDLLKRSASRINLRFDFDQLATLLGLLFETSPCPPSFLHGLFDSKFACQL